MPFIVHLFGRLSYQDSDDCDISSLLVYLGYMPNYKFIVDEISEIRIFWIGMFCLFIHVRLCVFISFYFVIVCACSPHSFLRSPSFNYLQFFLTIANFPFYVVYFRSEFDSRKLRGGVFHFLQSDLIMVHEFNGGFFQVSFSTWPFFISPVN